MVEAMHGEPIKGNIIAIDPGTTHSAVLVWENGIVDCDSDFIPNNEVVNFIERKERFSPYGTYIDDNGEEGDWDSFDENESHKLVIEGIQSYGAPVGKETFETCLWIGRFAQRWIDVHNQPFHLIYRPAIKAIVCGTTQSTDADVRASLLRLFPATGGGATPQVGTKAQPGPLYAISGHLWSALAVAVAFSAQPTEPLT